MRSTADMDILVEMSDENLKKVVSILKKNGFRVKQPVDPMRIADAKTRQDWIRNKHMKAFNFYKEDELKEVDIIIESPVSFEEAKDGLNKVKIGRLTANVISIDNLIKMKQGTQRDIDTLDIKKLRKIKKLRRG
jgi:acetolactate synthase regulatory subunit